MVDDNCFEEISCEEFYGESDPSIEVDWDSKLNSCLSAQETVKVLKKYHNTPAMLLLMIEIVNSLNLCEELIRTKIAQKDGK